MRAHPWLDRFIGLLLITITVLIILRDWHIATWASAVAPIPVVLVLVFFFFEVRFSRKIFVLVGIGLALWAVATRDDWQGILLRGLTSSAFIAAFFSALTTLRMAADTSPAIRRCGRYLANQPPGRRYIALTLGGQAFSLLLNYGSIVLLGSLTMASKSNDPNPEVNAHRTRRMLLAIQRGFISTLAWSPLSFAVAITTTVIPGASWPKAVLPSLITGMIVAAMGWAMDTVFKPKLSTPAAPRQDTGDTIKTVLPLVFLLAFLVGSVAVFYITTGFRITGLVTLIVPVIAASWIAIQAPAGRRLVNLGRRARDYAFQDLPNYRSELTLLIMAGFIGSVGGAMLGPIAAQSGLDLTQLPTWVILVALVWFIPLTGQLGMNPILSVVLMAPILPSPAALGVTPTAVMVAITAGWTMSGASSPYTATTMLIGNFAGKSALFVGLRWNGVYTLLTCAVLSVWVVLFSTLQIG